MQLDELQNIISNGTSIQSSGTTGTPKVIEQTPAKLKAADEVAIDSQKITSKSKIYTICKTTHAGGLLAQTLPGIRIGAEVVIEDFNAYRFVREVTKYTHTHITPDHGKAIIKTKGWRDLDLTGLWVTCGSDRVPWHLISAFVNKGATFMSNWGMTEIGPCAINTVFDSIDKVEEYRSKIIHGMDGEASLPILGDRYYCDVQISEWNELIVKGDICVYNDWFATGDKVVSKDNILYYEGRK
jgi:acyl-CoA synthetase (AMP-forming)/AMP-acid ligase II